MEKPSQRMSEVAGQEQSRLERFIRRRVPNPLDAEDLVQEVFFELAEANRLLMPIEHVTAWLYRVARNRITDLFRRRREEEDLSEWEELLPSPEAGPEALAARHLLLEEIEAALAELPEEQRDVFVAHELFGKSFREMSAETGVGVNTLLARKRYAVLRLRKRLQSVHDEWREE